MRSETQLVLDGSHGEGGGQILRTALFLSLLTGRAFRIEKIRQNRREPGLKPQHDGIIRLLREMTQSEVEGLRVGATELEFAPGSLRSGAYQYDIGTAGSIPLFLQTLLPVMLATPGRTELTLVGGTDVTFGPTIDWVRRTYAPLLQPLASRLSIDVDRRGFYPKGGGRVRVVVDTALATASLSSLRSVVVQALRSDRTRWEPPVQVEIISVAHRSLQARRVAERQAAGAQLTLQEAGFAAHSDVVYADAFSTGTSLTLVASDRHGNRIGADGLGRQGKPAETVGAEAATRWLADQKTGATVDEHLADHLVPWVALGAGPVLVPRTTGHLETNIWVCQRFLGPDCVRLVGREIIGSKKQS